MNINLNARRMVTLLTAGFVLLLITSHCFAQDCTTEWCDAKWPPIEGIDRTYGKDNCGNVCIKIAVETTVEVIDVVEVEVPAETPKTEITVTLKNDENGKPVMTASCPSVIETNQYDAKVECIKAGRKMKLYTRGGKIYSICEK